MIKLDGNPALKALGLNRLTNKYFPERLIEIIKDESCTPENIRNHGLYLSKSLFDCARLVKAYLPCADYILTETYATLLANYERSLRTDTTRYTSPDVLVIWDVYRDPIADGYSTLRRLLGLRAGLPHRVTIISGELNDFKNSNLNAFDYVQICQINEGHLKTIIKSVFAIGGEPWEEKPVVKTQESRGQKNSSPKQSPRRTKSSQK